MRLTGFTDYTLRVLMHLALKYGSGKLTTIDEVSRSYGISHNHLTKVVHHLARTGLISTSRGRSGGAALARAPHEISVGQVVRMTEPDFNVVECHAKQFHLCNIAPACGLTAALSRAVEAFLEELDKVTLADAIAEPKMAASLLGIDDGHFAYLRARPVPVTRVIE